MVFVTGEEAALRGAVRFSLLRGKTILFHGRALLGLPLGLCSHLIPSYVWLGEARGIVEAACASDGWLRLHGR